MVYRGSSKQGEIQQLQYEITNEISRDAKPIADGIFGNNARHPDMAAVSNDQLDELYRQKFQANDREWLQAEARRDPQQFEQITDRLGVTTPNPAPGEQPPLTTQQAVQQMVTTPPTPLAPPPAIAPVAPVAPLGGGMAPPIPVPPLPAAAPQLVGPNGLPLPPSGAV